MGDVALVVGEALVDVVRRNGEESAHAGGSAANCAVALSRLGRSVWLCSAWGPDAEGDLLAYHLARNGVSLAGDPCHQPRTSSATATIGTDGAATYVFDFTWSPEPAILSDDARVVVVACGSIGATADPGAQVVRAEMAQRRDTALAYYDLNARPQVTGKGPGLVVRAEHVVALSHLVKGSDEDLAVMWPGMSEAEVARRVFTLGASTLVVTKGEGGATWWSPTLCADVAMVPVDVVDTIGAGDTFGAAMVDALWSLGVVGSGAGERLEQLQAQDVDAVLSYAAAAAAVTVSRAGANPPYAAELR